MKLKVKCLGSVKAEGGRDEEEALENSRVRTWTIRQIFIALEWHKNSPACGILQLYHLANSQRHYSFVIYLYIYSL